MFQQASPTLIIANVLHVEKDHLKPDFLKIQYHSGIYTFDHDIFF